MDSGVSNSRGMGVWEERRSGFLGKIESQSQMFLGWLKPHTYLIFLKGKTTWFPILESLTLKKI